MSKRKSTKSHKPDALGQPGIAKAASKPKRAVSAPAPAILEEGELQVELQAAADTETRLLDLPGQEIDTILPPVPPPELEAKPALPPQLAEPKLEIAAAVGVLAEARDSAPATAGEASTASLSLRADRPLDVAPLDTAPSKTPLESSSERPMERSVKRSLERPLGAVAGIEACQTLFMEMTRDNLDFAASLASMRSPLEIIDVATKFAGKRMGMYGRFSRAFADIAAGRQAPMT